MSRPSWASDRWCNARLSEDSNEQLARVAELSGLATFDVLDALLRTIGEDVLVAACKAQAALTAEADKVWREGR